MTRKNCEKRLKAHCKRFGIIMGNGNYFADYNGRTFIAESINGLHKMVFGY